MDKFRAMHDRGECAIPCPLWHDKPPELTKKLFLVELFHTIELQPWQNPEDAALGWGVLDGDTNSMRIGNDGKVYAWVVAECLAYGKEPNGKAN